MQKHWLLPPLLIILSFFQAGCLTTMPKTLDEKAAVANEIGKFVTLVYYSEKEKVDSDGEIAQVYKIFSEVLAATDSGTLPILFRIELEKQIRAKVDESHRTLALGLVALYWNRLSARINIDKLTSSELLVVLRAFKQGVEEMRVVLKGPISGSYDWWLHHHCVCSERRFAYT